MCSSQVLKDDEKEARKKWRQSTQREYGQNKEAMVESKPTSLDFKIEVFVTPVLQEGRRRPGSQWGVITTWILNPQYFLLHTGQPKTQSKNCLVTLVGRESHGWRLRLANLKNYKEDWATGFVL